MFWRVLLSSRQQFSPRDAGEEQLASGAESGLLVRGDEAVELRGADDVGQVAGNGGWVGEVGGVASRLGHAWLDDVVVDTHLALGDDGKCVVVELEDPVANAADGDGRVHRRVGRPGEDAVHVGVRHEVGVHNEDVLLSVRRLGNRRSPASVNFDRGDDSTRGLRYLLDAAATVRWTILAAEEARTRLLNEQEVAVVHCGLCPHETGLLRGSHWSAVSSNRRQGVARTEVGGVTKRLAGGVALERPVVQGRERLRAALLGSQLLVTVGHHKSDVLQGDRR